LRTYSDRSLQNGNTLVRSMSRDDVPVNAPPFFRKPLDEACSVADLTSAFRQRLALLRRHDRGEILLIGHDQFEPLTQDGRTRLGRLRSPGRQGGIRELNGASRFQCTHVWHCADNGARRRVFDVCRLSGFGLHPLATIRQSVAQQLRFFRLSVDSHARLPIFFGAGKRRAARRRFRG
jgi:hypothetical protein